MNSLIFKINKVISKSNGIITIRNQTNKNYNSSFLFKRTYLTTIPIIKPKNIENINKILNNLPNPKIEKEKFISNSGVNNNDNNNDNEKLEILKSQKSIEFKGLLDTLRFPHELYQDKLEGVIDQDKQEDAEEEKQEFHQIGGLKATIHSRSGSVFEGQVNEHGIPHGFGELDLKNGDFYLGYFENGKKQGRGRLISISGCQYDGEWKDDMHWGQGRFDENEKKISYQGEWMANERHGLGVHTDPKSEIKGIWEHDHLVFGHEVKKDVQLEYYGEFKNEQWHGNGKVSFPDGSIYQGEFVDGVPFGKGRFYKPNDDGTDQITENDNWKRGLICGKGRIFSDGWCCEGVWNENGDIHNAKVMIKGHGIYEGDINNQYLPHGNGIEYLDNGDIYTGNFIDGKREGYGEVVWADSSQYKGNWLRGLRVGKGTIIQSDQITTIQGDHKEIQLDNNITKLNSKGTLTTSDGIYIGELENGIPEGYGEYKIINSDQIQKGFWKNGKLIDK